MVQRYGDDLYRKDGRRGALLHHRTAIARKEEGRSEKQHHGRSDQQASVRRTREGEKKRVAKTDLKAGVSVHLLAAPRTLPKLIVLVYFNLLRFSLPLSIFSSRSRLLLSPVSNDSGTNPVYFGTLLRLATIPTVVKNYGLALLAITLPQYLVCCIIGSFV